MTKDEYIAKFGEEYYINRLAKLRERYKLNPTTRRNAAKKWKQNNHEYNMKLNKEWKQNNHAYNMRINKKTYQAFCVETEWNLIENYELAKADNFKGWDCHHRLELHPDNSIRFTRKSLRDLNLYYNRPASELIFLTHADHTRIHSISRGHNE